MNEWIYGRRTVMEQFASLPDTCERLLIAEGAKHDPALFEAAAKAGVKVEKAKKQKLDTLAVGGNHQGVCLRVGGWKYEEFDQIIEKARTKGNFPVIFVLDCVQDPRNLGAVIRVADGVGAAGVVIPKDRSAGLSAAVARSSAGALATVDVALVVNVSRAIRQLKAEGFFVVGAAMGENTLFSTRLNFPLAIVMGAEGRGLRPNVAAQCDTLSSLPMEGGVDSLNISVAAGVFAYESWRRFKGL